MQDIKEDIDAESSRLLSTDALIAAATALGGFEASPSREPTTEFKREGDEVVSFGSFLLSFVSSSLTYLPSFILGCNSFLLISLFPIQS